MALLDSMRPSVFGLAVTAAIFASCAAEPVRKFLQPASAGAMRSATNRTITDGRAIPDYPPQFPRSIIQPMGPNSTAWRRAGVNVGGWLVLEDYFFSGTGGEQVSSLPGKGQGACLPPAIVGPLETPWTSEGTLTKWIADSQGSAMAASALKAHRDTFITEEDYTQMSTFGIKTIRIPLTWAVFADALSGLDPAYGKHDPDVDTAIVADPFYTDDIYMATVPRAWLKEQIKLAAAHGMSVVLDLHGFPGGSSQGTYNGVWPLAPVFWSQTSKHGGKKLTDVGLMIVKALIDWVKELIDSGVTTIAGICAMNEPALNQDDVETSAVYEWLGASMNLFEESGVGAHGVYQYMNLIGKSLAGAPNFIWGFPKSQQDLLILDIHYYMAWSTGDHGCCGSTQSGQCGYECADSQTTVDSHLYGCAAGGLTSDVFSSFPRKATTEFSLGTYKEVSHACGKPAVLDMMLASQATVFEDQDIEGFFWTWRMPYGPNFEAGWSLKRHLGLEKQFDANMCKPPLTL